MKLFFSVLLLTFSFCLLGQEVAIEYQNQYAFRENKGQWGQDILFQSPFKGGNFWVQQNKFVFHFQDFSALRRNHGNFKSNKNDTLIPQSVLHYNFLNSNKVTHIEKARKSSHYYNYFLGNNKNKWASEVYAFEEIKLLEYYKGIDLKLHATNEQTKYEFIVKPNFDYKQIQIEVAGAEKIQLLKSGNIEIVTKAGTLIEKKPFIYQIINGKIIEINSKFIVNGKKISFEIDQYQTAYELVIDPTLVFATYSGSVTDNFGMTATYGYDKTAYSGGTIYGNAYPTPDNSAYDVNSNFTVANNATYGITDVFISKYAPNGTSMLWTTFLGGGDGVNGTETVHSLICDKTNNIYLFGATSSTDFPIVNGYQSTHNGGTSGSNFYYNGVYFTGQGTDIYVAKISTNGHNLLGSTYLGGTKNDGINTKITSGIYNSFAAYDSLTKNYGDTFRGEIMLDQNDNILIASSSRSNDFPLNNPIQGSIGGQQDGVIAKLNNNLSTLLWSTFVGGSNNDACNSIKIDSSYNIVFAGGTCSSNFPFVSTGLQSTYGGGKADGFVVKYNPTTASVLAGTLIGYPSYDQAFFVEVDRNDNIFVLGHSESSFFPVINAGYADLGSSQYIAKYNPTLTTILNSTVFGNGSPNVNISPAAFLVDICGNIYVSGWGANILQGVTLSGMPITSDAMISTPPNGYDFYLMVLKRDFSSLLYGTYLGGNQAQEHVDGGTSRFDKNGIVYQSVCGGCGGFSDFPTSAGAWSNNNLSSNCNNILFKFDFDLIPNANFTPDQTIGCTDFTVNFSNTSSASDSYLWDFGNGDTSTVIFNPVKTYTQAGVYDVFLFVTDSICLLTDTAKITITVLDSIKLAIPNDTSLCSPINLNFLANSFGTASGFIWSSSPNFTDTLNTSISDSTLSFTPSGSMTLYIKTFNAGCSKTDSLRISFVSSAVEIFGDTSLCVNETSLLTTSNTSGFTFVYNWQPSASISGPTNGPSALANPLTSQYIYLTGTASNGCVVKDSIYISVSNLNGVNVVATASEYTVAEGSTVTLYGQPSGYQYQWTPINGLTSPTSQNTQAEVNQTTLYTLTVTDGVCAKSDTVLVKSFQFICGEPYVFIPNAFSPNGDNENDILFVRGSLIKDMVFRVYDRWGELVFESFDRLKGWDGTFRGKKMDPDVYDYYLKVTCIDDQESIIKGNITLLK